MWEVIAAAVGLIGTAGGAIWAAYIGTRRRVLTELEGRYDAELRESRLTVYPALWASLEPLARYAREPPGRPTRSEIEDLTKALRSWYFDVGGIYLSVEAREAFFRLQEALTVVTTSTRWKAADAPSNDIDEGTFEALRAIGSWLRTTLTYDVGTRRPFSLTPAWRKKDADPDHDAAGADRNAEREAQYLMKALRSQWG